MEKTKYDVFISYRRKGGYETAKHIYDLLIRDGYNVSFDLDTLRNGDFDKQLLTRIDECTDFILILNKGAFDRSIDPKFDRNKDWMRIELAEAISKGKNIIPIMLEGFDSYPEDLPDDIYEVRRKNSPKYSMEYFDEFYRKIKKDFMKSEPSSEQKFEMFSYENIEVKDNDVIVNFICSEKCRFDVDDKIIGEFHEGDEYHFTLNKGKHLFRITLLGKNNFILEKEFEILESHSEIDVNYEFKIGFLDKIGILKKNPIERGVDCITITSKDNPAALFNLGLKLYKGSNVEEGIKINKAKGRDLIIKAAELKYLPAIRFILDTNLISLPEIKGIDIFNSKSEEYMDIKIQFLYADFLTGFEVDLSTGNNKIYHYEWQDSFDSNSVSLKEVLLNLNNKDKENLFLKNLEFRRKVEKSFRLEAKDLNIKSGDYNMEMTITPIGINHNGKGLNIKFNIVYKNPILNILGKPKILFRYYI